MAAAVSPIVDIIIRLWTYCARHTRYLRKLQENKMLLSTAMDELKEARDDVQRRVVEAEADPNEPKKRTDPVRGWLERVQIIEGGVQEILQKANEQLSRARCLGGCCPPNNCWNSYKLGKSIAKKIPSVDELKGKGSFEELTYRIPQPFVHQDMNLESTVGMESMFDKVWRLITSTATDDKPVRIMGLYGLPGVGKTTLLEKINNEFNKSSSEHGFDHVVIFVVVSKPINYDAILKKIEERLGLQGDGDENSRAEKIFNKLRNRNFVILLDDIWERVDLRRIGIPLSPHNSYSKVIFTTRNREVCGLMEATHTFQVECLPWDKAWRLFQDKVGEEALTCFPRAHELAELVAKECGGLPLALITIGRAMSARKSVKEWKDALRTLTNSASEFPGMSDEVLPRLKFSYDNLPNETMKSCFLYCALYPEDHFIEIAQLIDCWIAGGFLNGFDNNLNEARSHGHHVIETLKRACLLESSLDGSSYVKMHDVIRDLALWIVNDCKSNSSKTTGKFLVAPNNVCERWRNAERIFLMYHGFNNVSEEPPTSPNLRTLIVKPTSYLNNFSLPQSFFQLMHFLRVLDLSKTRFSVLATSIGELSDLQYLSLASSFIKELPVELGKLVKLKFLDLTDTFYLSKIPAGVIANLSELQVLKLEDSGFKNWELKEEEDGGSRLSFDELDRLKQLQEVGITINTSLALEKLLCNQKLQKICTSLTLKKCVNLKSISFPPLLLSSSTIISEGLRNLTSLNSLSIKQCSELEELTLSINEDGETNNRWWYNNKLEILHLVSLPRLKNIVWGEKYHHYYMAAAQQKHYLHYVSPFQNLYEIIIWNGGALKDLAWLVYVENLKTLSVTNCEELETIIELGDGDGGLEEAGGGGDQMLNTGGRGVFRRLKTLEILDLPKLKSICRHALAFPSIQIIHIFECPELKKLPLDSGSNVNNTLKGIAGSTEWWDELQWEDETIKSKFLPYFR